MIRMIVLVASPLLLQGVAHAWESLPPPPPTEAERALWSYSDCLWEETEAERGSAPVSASRAKAAVARAIAACQAEKAEAHRKMLVRNFENIERGPVPGPDFYESHLVSHLQKPKAAHAPN